MTPLKIEEDGSVVLINRGWIPRHFVLSDKKRSSTSSMSPQKQEWNRPTGTVEVVGIPVKPEREYRVRRAVGFCC